MGAGAAVGLPFVLFTFGLSVPISALIGGGVAGSTGLIAGGTTGCATGGTLGYTVFTWRKELADAMNKSLAKLKETRDASRVRCSSVFAAIKTRLGAMRSSIVTRVQNATVTTKQKMSAMTNSSL